MTSVLRHISCTIDAAVPAVGGSTRVWSNIFQEPTNAVTDAHRHSLVLWNYARVDVTNVKFTGWSQQTVNIRSKQLRQRVDRNVSFDQ